MNRQQRSALESTVAYGVALLALLFVFGSCAKITVSCWRRGGSVVRNVFDWPTCVEPRK